MMQLYELSVNSCQLKQKNRELNKLKKVKVLIMMEKRKQKNKILRLKNQVKKKISRLILMPLQFQKLEWFHLKRKQCQRMRKWRMLLRNNQQKIIMNKWKLMVQSSEKRIWITIFNITMSKVGTFGVRKELIGNSMMTKIKRHGRRVCQQYLSL